MSTLLRLAALRTLLQADIDALPDLSPKLEEQELDVTSSGMKGDPVADLSMVVPPGESSSRVPPAVRDTQICAPEMSFNQDGKSCKLVIMDSRTSQAISNTALNKITEQTPYKDSPTQFNNGKANDHPAIPIGNAAETSSAMLIPGQVSLEHQEFSPVIAVSRFPYKLISKEDSEAVANRLFNGGQFWQRHFDLFYVWTMNSIDKKAIILIPLTQFEDLLHDIEASFPNVVPSNGRSFYRSIGLIAQFPQHPELQPRFLGRSTCRDDFDRLRNYIPAANYSIGGEDTYTSPDEDQMEAYTIVTEKFMDLQKRNTDGQRVQKEKQRSRKIKDALDELRLSQQYLGLRDSINQVLKEPRVHTSGNAKNLVDMLSSPPYSFYEDTILISVDLEADEHSSKFGRKVTEIGISTLDTRDLAGLAPGTSGHDWFKKIRSRHIRIHEYGHIRNKDYVAGCPDDFNFGQSEWISLRDAPQAIANCFKEPFSGVATGDTTGTDEGVHDAGKFEHLAKTPENKRNIVLVGHDVKQDVRYLQNLGYDPSNLSNLTRVLDTARIFKSYCGESQITSLANMLYYLEIPFRNLHNAGNDATYTLQALLAIALRSSVETHEQLAEQTVIAS